MRRVFLRQSLAFLRTRVAGAVTMPALLAGAYAVMRNAFRLPLFLLMVLGLAAAEFADLILSDLVAEGKIRGFPPGGAAARAAMPALPGSPVSPRLLSPSGAARALLSCGISGAAALAVFLAIRGPGILFLLAAAAACAFLYAFSPFPGSFLATACVPALITGGGFYAMTGSWETEAFLAGIPVCLVSVGVILTYRAVYRDGGIRRGAIAAVLLFYAGSLSAVAALSAGGIYPARCLFALAPGAPLLAFAARQFRLEGSDPVPATAAGVLLHTVLSLSLAATLAS